MACIDGVQLLMQLPYLSQRSLGLVFRPLLSELGLGLKLSVAHVRVYK